MKILVSDPLGQSDYKLVAETTDPDVIEEKLFEPEWESLTGIRIEIDGLNWIDLSGSKDDGFSIIYSDGENEWITKDAPESLEQSILAVQSYAMKGNEWKELFEWEHFNKAGAKPAGCASVIILLFILTPIISFGSYHLLQS